jgi:DDE family transposase
MDNAAIKKRFEKLTPYLDERLRRLVAAAEALAIGRGGITAVARETGLCRESIRNGCLELENTDKSSPSRIRRVGAGRKRTIDQDPTLRVDLERLVDPVTRGDPESPLRWTCKSTRQLASALIGMGHKTSHRMVAELLHNLGYSLQSNRKTLEGNSHPDRNAQFEHIYQQVKCFQASGDPIISVDTKKKELVGQFKQAGQEWQPVGQPESVQVHDFQDVELGKVAPYGVYDPTLNMGWVNVGTDHDTSQFAVESIRRWWHSMGLACYPAGKRLLITADGGGSNGSRVRLWKRELQTLASELGMAISVCHYPPGTSKWNNIEHRLFSYITLNWRGKPLVSHEVVVNLIASTTNRKGLQVHCELDNNQYPKGIKVTNNEMEALKLDRDEFHGEWNYTISP